MHKYGLIGRYLGHSFSAEYFRNKIAQAGADAVYVPLEIATIDALPTDWDGYSVTIPYKEAILPFLSDLDETARAIGAVNVVKGRKGYNTDWIGFCESIRPLLRAGDQKALVLGTGGAAKAVLYGLQQLGITTETVSRTRGLRYRDLRAEDMHHWQLIVNCTPVGMWPDVDVCPAIPYEGLTTDHLLFDCIYNPEETLFLRHGREHGARVKNGMEMLLRQADEAWKIWNN